MELQSKMREEERMGMNELENNTGWEGSLENCRLVRTGMGNKVSRNLGTWKKESRDESWYWFKEQILKK